MAGRPRASKAVAKKKRSTPRPPDGGASADSASAAEEFARRLTENERTALAIRDELYGGSWTRMREDLEARRTGRPYVFRLASRIDEDLRIIEKLSEYESREKVDLSAYVEEGR